MRRLRCPRCSTSVLVAPEERPVCTACRYGAKGAVSATPAHTPPSERTPRTRPVKSRAPVVAAFVVAGLLLIGAVVIAASFGTGLFNGDDAQPLDEETARQRAELALSSFSTELDRPDGGALKTVAMTFSVEDAGDEDFSYGGDGSLTIDWGANDVLRVSATWAASGMSFSMGYHCTADRLVMAFGSDTYEARPNAECTQLIHDVDADGIPFDASDEDLADAVIDIHPDGSTTVRFTDADGMEITAEIDDQGRLMAMAGEDSESAFTVSVEYGLRPVILMPGAEQRMPADLYGSTRSEGADLRWSAGELEPDLPRDEFQVILRDLYRGDELARFDLDAGTQTVGNYTFTWLGDRDGILEAHDSFVISATHWQDPSDHVGVGIKFYDEWAGAEVGTVGMPSLGPTALLAALGGAALLVRRAKGGEGNDA